MENTMDSLLAPLPSKLKKCCAINQLINKSINTIYFNCNSYLFSLETPDLLINPEISIP